MHILKHVIHRLFQEAAGDDGGGAGGGEGGAQTPDPAVEQRAKEMGWAPKEQWRGNPEHWIDAQTFVQRGEQVMPILQANLRQRDAQVASMRQEQERLRTQLQAANESIQVLTNLSTEQGRKDAKEKRRELLRQQAEARREGDTELEINLGEQIADVTSQINAAQEENQGSGGGGGTKTNGKGGQQQQANDPPPDPTRDPAYQAFLQENSWFGTDRRKTALATAIGEELRSDPTNSNLVGKPFFDKVAAEVAKMFPTSRQTTSKVEGQGQGNTGASRSEVDQATGKSYADLPQDAKEACERSAKLVVGEGRAFKDLASWRKHYISQYFNS